MSASPLKVGLLKFPFDAALTMPGSKSHANRAIIAACLAKGETVIEHATPCDDVALLVKNLQKMRFDIRYTNRAKGTLMIRGGIPRKIRMENPTELYCGNAGTTLRFLTSLACLVPGAFLVTGSDRMLRRPIRDLTLALKCLGAEMTDTHGCPPVHVRGGTIRGGRTTLNRSISSQYLTSLLLIGPCLKEGLSIECIGTAVSEPYVDLTQKVLNDFGVTLRRRRSVISLRNTGYKSPRSVEIEGDWSAAGAFLVLAELTSSRVSFSNLKPSSAQADAKLSSMIAHMRRRGSLVIDCGDMPDQVMNLAVLAAFRNGKTIITGAENLKFKECDRIAVLTKELKKAGIRIEKRNDGVLIHGKSNIKKATLDPHNDHRMAFCFAILGSVHPGIRIRNPACVSKSYPRFFRDLRRIQESPRCIAIVGMRGCGKSTLAKKLATKLQRTSLDTDQLFQRRHGPLRKFVQKHGWNKFRKYEERIVNGALKSRSVVSLGGGAIESAATRALLKRETIVIHLDAPAHLLIERLRKGKRPPLTLLPLAAEVRALLKRRTPLYRSLASIRVRHSDDTAHIAHLLRTLCSL